LGQVQQILDDAKRDNEKHAGALSDIAEKYGQASPDKSGGQGQGGSDQGNQGNGQVGGSAGNGQGSQVGGGDPGGGQASGNGLIDPLAGMGANPLGMLGPELAGLGSAIPAVGGLAGAPLDALGALAGLGGLGQHGPRFVDDGPRRAERDPEFTDDPEKKGAGNDGKHPQFTDTGNTTQGQQGQQEQQQPVAQPNAGTPVGAAPAANAGGDPAKVVQMPDGLPPVTATSDKAADLVRGVLNGQSLTDAAKAAGVEIPAPGTPVHPIDPNRLVPGMLAQYRSREPVMWMGNDRIWLDGQLQPKTALPQRDLMCWFDPFAVSQQQPAPPIAPAPAPQPVPSPNTGT
jgi:hypothetical protein